MVESFFDWELQFRNKEVIRRNCKLLPDNKKLNSLGVFELDFKKVMEKYKND